MDNTSELTNIFRSDFWGLFSPLFSLSNLLYLLSQLNVHVYTVSPSSSLAPPDVSSPLVVMATSSSITATGGGGGGASAHLLGSPDHDLQHAGTTETVVTGLQPSEVAYNAGGSTQSNASSVTTIESSPDGVPFSNVTIINATSLAIVWSTPLVPNGIVTGYVVLQTNIPVCHCVQSRNVMSSSSPSFPQPRMDLMLCRCSMWAPPT